MLKQILTLASFAVGITVNAQGIYQFTDPGFEDWTNDNVPGHEWHSFESAKKTQHFTWYNTGKQKAPKPSKSKSKDGSIALHLFSKDLTIAKANGNITTGVIGMGSSTPDNENNYNLSDITTDGQHLVFAGRPDKVSFDAKFKSGGSENARGRFILHGAINYRDPDMINGEYRMVNGKSLKDYLIGEAVILVPKKATAEWDHYEAEFTYNKEQPQTQYLLASLTTNPVPGGSANDEFDVDNIKFTYYSTLESLSYDNATIDFSENTFSYNLSSVSFDEKKLHYKAKGKGATTSFQYDNKTGIATITVNGNDISVNPSNKTTYTIQFGIAKTTVYKNDLSVTLVDGYTTTPPEENNISLISEPDNTISLELKNFVLGGDMPIGNIKVTNLEKTGNTYTKSQEIKISKGDDPKYKNEDWKGPSLGIVNVNVTATVNGDQLIAQISIVNFPNVGDINVTFAPTIKFAESQNIETTAGVKNIVMHRTFKEGWNTVCLPFSTTATNLQKDGGCVVQEFVSADKNGLTFRNVANDVIEANKPYLVYFAYEVVYDETDPLCYGGNLEASNPTPVTHGAYTFTGNYTAGMNMNGKYGVADFNGVQKLRIGGAKATLPAGCAYFTTINNANGMLIRLDGGNTTGILDVNTGVVVENTAVYNLQGVKVSNNGTAGLPAGIYVMGGKKVIVK